MHRVRDVARQVAKARETSEVVKREMLGDGADVVIGEEGLAVGVGDSSAQPPRGRRKAWQGRGVVEKDGPQGQGGNLDFGTLVEATGTKDATLQGAVGRLAICRAPRGFLKEAAAWVPRRFSKLPGPSPVCE